MDTHIASMNLVSDPFKIGDKISLDVVEIDPLVYMKYDDEYLEMMMAADNIGRTGLNEKFKDKMIKIIDKRMHIDIMTTDKSNLTIKYYCVYLKT